MKKNKLTFAIAFVLVFCALAIAIGAQFKPYAFPLVGKWQPARDSLLVDDYGFQDIQNLRKYGRRLKGVSGHTYVNTTEWSTTTEYPNNGFHYKKESPVAETHVLVHAYQTNEASGIVYRNTTAIASQGDFVGTVFNTDSSGAGIGRFSNAPQASMLYANGVDTKIWNGSEAKPVAFITSTAAITDLPTNPRDYSDQVRNSLTDGDNVAAIGGGDDSFVTLLLHVDDVDAGTVFTDDGETGHTRTLGGDVQADIDQTQFGQAAALFDGNGDYLAFPDHASWAFGSGEFTIDFWVRFNTIPSHASFFNQWIDGSNFLAVNGYEDGNEIIQFQFRSYSGGVADINWLPSLSTNLVASQWYHIAIIRGWGGAADDYAITVDGSSVATTTDASVLTDQATTLEIGAYNGGSNPVDGWIDEFRVSKGKARWTSNFTPPVRSYRAAAKDWLVGYYRPLQGVKYYVADPNLEASTMTVKEWQGSSWVTLTATDNTDTGASLAQTGTVTWTATNQAEVRYIQGLSLYWYNFSIGTGEATISQVTVDAPFQTVKNIWDGTESDVASAKLYEDSTYKEYTDELQDDTTTYVAVLDALASTEFLYLGFVEPQQGFNIYMAASEENTNAATLTVSHWGGSSWVPVSGLNDKTEEPIGDSLGKTGVVSFSPVAPGEEFQRNIADEIPLYYYKLGWSAALDASVDMFHVKGIPAPQPLKAYSFPGEFQGRALLFDEKSNERNKLIYSAYNAPDIWNGSDSGALYFGGDDKIVAAATIYNVYRTTGIEQLLVFKANETYRLFGDGPDNWEQQQMSGNVGATAALSVAVADIAAISIDTQRHVVIWQGAAGVYMSDGATIELISHDIANYWDPNSSDFIPTNRQDDSFGWYDPILQAYKLLISSGSGQTTHNVELEYSLLHQEWTKIYRKNGSGANPLQAGFVVTDTDGSNYSYGVTDEGKMYYLNNGNNWNGTAIDQYVWTKDFLMDSEMPFFKHTVIKYFRMLYENKATSAEVTIAHYCDGTLTTDGSGNQAVPDKVDIKSGNKTTDDCNLGPCLKHSFKLSTSTSGLVDGMELLGLGFYYDSLKAIRE
jgi:hypothetical protein